VERVTVERVTGIEPALSAWESEDHRETALCQSGSASLAPGEIHANETLLLSERVAAGRSASLGLPALARHPPGEHVTDSVSNKPAQLHTSL
jgi:hypothetical protein